MDGEGSCPVLFEYGHIETMAYAVAEGARAAGATVDVKRVPETVPEAIAKAAYFKLDQPAPIATPAELANYDAIIVGARPGSAACLPRWGVSGSRPARCG